MTIVKTNEIIKFKVASEIPNIEKSTSLQSGLILFRDLIEYRLKCTRV